MVRGERLISFPTKTKIGTQTFKLKPLTTTEQKERVAFTKTIMQTTEYKRLTRKGIPRTFAIFQAAKKIQTNRTGKWFSVKRLPIRLQNVAKKYWVK